MERAQTNCPESSFINWGPAKKVNFALITITQKILVSLASVGFSFDFFRPLLVFLDRFLFCLGCGDSDYFGVSFSCKLRNFQFFTL